MDRRIRNSAYLLGFWPLVLLALLARLTFGGVVTTSSVFDDSLKELTKLSVFCDPQEAYSAPDKHHHQNDQQDDAFLLSDALDLFQLTIAFCALIALSIAFVHRVWMFTPIRGPPTPERASQCPQGPPA